MDSNITDLLKGHTKERVSIMRDYARDPRNAKFASYFSAVGILHLTAIPLAALLVATPATLVALVAHLVGAGGLASMASMITIVAICFIAHWCIKHGRAFITHIYAASRLAPNFNMSDTITLRILKENWDAICERVGWSETVEKVKWSGARGLFSPQEQISEKASVAPRIREARSIPGGLEVTVDIPRGASVAAYARAEDAWATALGVEAVQITDQHSSPPALSMKIVREDSLREMSPISTPYSWDGDWAAVPVGMNRDGNTATIAVREVSGLVVGGLPGGGKTAALTSLLATMVCHPAVQVHVWDGKGGADWSWIEPRAALYNNDDEDRERVADELEAIVQVMRQRLKDLPRVRGGSSIWNTGGPSWDMPLLVCVVDECQAFLDATAIPRGDKEAVAARSRTEAAIATLVRKGRSAGVLVIPTTQKPTTDSLPSTIGANAAAAVSFRVKTPQAEIAVLGSGPADGEPSATALPPVPGYAVVVRETGTREVVRFAYLPEQAAAAQAQRYAHLRANGPATESRARAAEPSAAEQRKEDQ